MRLVPRAESAAAALQAAQRLGYAVSLAGPRDLDEMQGISEATPGLERAIA